MQYGLTGLDVEVCGMSGYLTTSMNSPHSASLCGIRPDPESPTYHWHPAIQKSVMNPAYLCCCYLWKVCKPLKWLRCSLSTHTRSTPERPAMSDGECTRLIPSDTPVQIASDQEQKQDVVHSQQAISEIGADKKSGHAVNHRSQIQAKVKKNVEKEIMEIT